MDEIKLRLNEIKFHNIVINALKKTDVTQLRQKLDTLLKLTDHPAPIAISNAWMSVVSYKLEPTQNELIILMYKDGHSKNNIRKLLGVSPNTVYKRLTEYEQDPYTILPRLDKSTSEYVTLFIEGIEEALEEWKGSLI